MSLFGTNKEQQILRLFATGDVQAMDRLYAEYAGYLTGVCVRYIPNREDLHDVLQESFVKIFVKIGTFEYRGKGSLQAWMARVVINEALHFLRDQNTTMFVDCVQEPTDVPDEEPDVCGLSEKQLLDMIERLPAGYRVVFNLFVMEGKSHKEIAALLNIKPDTSASQFYKARNLLAKMIKEQRKKEERR